MKNVRIFYKKLGRMKFVSHLDMTRFMSRLIAKSKIPVWYTEGFNQHIYMNFAVPLSLGFEGNYEVLDIKLTDDSFSCEECLSALKSVAIADIEFFKVTEPWQNMKEIAFAEYRLSFEALPSEKLFDFLNQDSILCEKKGKKGKVKQIDLIPKIKSYKIDRNDLYLTLVAGNEDTLNPSLVLSEFFSYAGLKPVYVSVTRTAILNKSGQIFE